MIRYRAISQLSRRVPGGLRLDSTARCSGRVDAQVAVSFLSAASARSLSSSSTLQSLSYRQAAPTVPLLGKTIGQVVEETTEKFPSREYLVVTQDNVRRTFAQFKDECDRFAAGLTAIGIQKNDRVGIWGPSSLEWVLTQFATAKIGAVLVNLNPAYRQHELDYAMKKVGVNCIVSAQSFKTQDYYEMLSGICPELATATPGDIKSSNLPMLRSVVMMGKGAFPGAFMFDDVMDMGKDEHFAQVEKIQPAVQFDDPINIQFTSGTTGQPKGATLTHHNIVNNSYFIGKELKYDEKEHRISVPVPLYHCFGMVGGSLCAMVHGATCVIPAPSFEAEASLKVIQEERITSQYGTPTMFIDMLNHPDFSQYDMSSLSTGIMAGSPCPIETMKLTRSLMNMKDVSICYGLTEVSPVICQTQMHDPVDLRVSTVGRPAAHNEIKVIDPQTGALVPYNTPGELCSRGYTTMIGYWEDEAKTKSAIDATQWFHTGDLATMSEDGYLTIVGRIKDMVIRGGENLYPTEIEQFLYKHPKIEDVQVIGVPDERMGEELCAWIRLKAGQEATAEEIKAFCKGEISHFKIPRYIEFVKEFPLTVTGKVQKFVMREAMIEKMKKSFGSPGLRQSTSHISRAPFSTLSPSSSSLSPSLSRPLSTSTPAPSRPRYTMSYVQGPSTPPLMGKTMGQCMDEMAESKPDYEAYAFLEEGVRMTFSQFKVEVDRLAAGLLALGLEKGDRIAMWGSNSSEWVLTMFAAAKIGAILVTINLAYRPTELQFALEKAGVKAIVSAQEFKTQNYYEMLSAVCPELPNSDPGRLKSSKLPMLESIVMLGQGDFPGTFMFNDVIDMGTSEHRASVEQCAKTVQFDDPLAVMFTSGTTGNPKGATMTHHRIVNNGYHIGCRVGHYKGDHRVCLPLPLYHIFASVAGPVVGITHGVTCVFPTAGYDAEAALVAAQDEKCTFMYGTPTMFIDMMSQPCFKELDLSSIQSGVIGGAPCSPELLKQITVGMGMKYIAVGFGMTECGPLITVVDEDDVEEKLLNTVGRMCQHMEGKVVDPETGFVLPVNTPGELCVRGYGNMTGYWENEKATRDAIKPTGWLHTGDLATFDEEGYISIVGRIKDLIIKGGRNIHPVEVEDFIHSHPKVEDVEVIGIADDRLGEEIVACVRVKAGEELTQEEIINYCKGEISHYKIPRYVVFVDAFPMTVTGKVQKFKLREMVLPDLKKD